MALMKDFHNLSGEHKNQVKKLVSEHEKKINSLNRKIVKIKK